MAVEPRSLPNPPITEALVEIRVDRAVPVPLDDLKQLQARLGAAYTQAVPIRQVKAEIAFTSLGSTHVGQPPSDVAFQFSTADNQHVVHASPEFLSVHLLRPYRDWEAFRADIVKAWSEYVSIAAPSGISRIGVRYINRLDIPVPMNDLADYLTTGPMIDPKLPQRFSSLFTRIEIPFPAENASSIVTQALVPSGRPDRAALLLDIDAYSQMAFALDDTVLWATIDRLRDIKNKLFFGSITEKSLELFR